MTPEMLVAVLAWTAVGLGGAVLTLLIWFALRVVSQLDTLAREFIDANHKVDLRLVKLEAAAGWAKRQEDS